MHWSQELRRSWQEPVCDASLDNDTLCRTLKPLQGIFLLHLCPSQAEFLLHSFLCIKTFPCVALIFKVLPTTAASGIDAMIAPYAVTLFFAGFLASW